MTANLRASVEAATDNNSAMAQMVLREQRRSMWQAFPLTLAGNFLMAVLLYFLVRKHVPQWTSDLWLILLLLQFAVPAFLITKVRTKTRPLSAHLAATLRVVGSRGWLGALISGSMWGGCCALFVFYGRPIDQLVTLFVVAGMGMGGIYTMGFQWRTYCSYVWPAVIPLVLANIARGRATDFALALMCVLYLAFVTFACRIFTRTIDQSHRLGFVNSDLVKALAQQRDAATLANAQKTVFLASASHDLRQPLNALSLYLYTLSTVDLSPFAAKILKNSQTSVQALGDLLSSLLVSAQIETGAIVPKNAQVDVRELLNRVRVTFTPLALSKGISLRLVNTKMFVVSDAMLLERVVRNLTANALQYTQSGGVLISARARGGQCLLQVWDTGTGIAREHLKQIFEPYYRGTPNAEVLHHSTNDDGVGLGLAIVRQLADALGVRVEVQSRVGRGTVFTICIASEKVLEAVDVGGSATSAQVLPAEVIRADTGKAHLARQAGGAWIALMEDDAASFDALDGVLQSQGLRVVGATRFEALRTLLVKEQLPPTAILSDYRLMGKADGLSVIAFIREEFNCDAPAMLITADVTTELETLCRDACVVLERKPIAAGVLVDWVLKL